MADGLRDFWTVYEQHYDAILASTMRAAAAHREFAPIIAAMPPELIAEQNRQSRARLSRAVVDGDWREYEHELRLQGSTYAKMGISFAGWYDLVGSFKRELVPLVVQTYLAEPERLSGALQAMHG